MNSGASDSNLLKQVQFVFAEVGHEYGEWASGANRSGSLGSFPAFHVADVGDGFVHGAGEEVGYYGTYDLAHSDEAADGVGGHGEGAQELHALFEGGEGVGFFGKAADVDADEFDLIVEVVLAVFEVFDFAGEEAAGVEAVLEAVAIPESGRRAFSWRGMGENLLWGPVEGSATEG
jgi:hypothetical protein